MRIKMDDIREFQLKEILQIFLRWKKQILIIVLSSLIIGTALAFIIERQYKSVAVLLPPKEQSMLGLSSISNMMKSIPSGLGKFTGAKDDSYDYVAILRSRTVMEEVINKFDLKRVYSISDSSMEKTIKEFKANSEVEWADGDIFEIRIWDFDAMRAAEITNYLVEILNRRSYELHSQEAHNNRIFIENRVKQNQIDLKKAEEELQRYQEKTGTIVVTQSSTQGVSSIAELYGMKARKELEIGVLQKTVGKDNAELKQKQIELQTLNEKTKNIPELGINSLRLYRELAIQQKILEFIIPLYEEARVNEHKDIPVAYVLDKGIPGERPDRPKRLFILGISLFIGILLSLLLVVFKESFPLIGPQVDDRI